ncbi:MULTISPECIES: hypothetical protein [Calothrix]|uniref:Uncharacterized protein n=2 Tax=Calothrix TaxID=1186 RepID=A0ABR8ALC5_9CYAN|nr:MULTISPECIES: hypothetical protein [Calothrix]MBD2199436.1 hypothetical protein [Calothrix parietina FACHB-288]MBD2228237.1 hypothetical protein [Calothrix anomala FACHB-343]
MKIEFFNINLSELIQIYNHVPNLLSRKAIKVSLTEDSLITQNNQLIFLENARNGNYWVIATEDSNYWLLPKTNLKIDSFKYETLKSLFHCDGYQPENTSKFSLLHPARVSLTPSSLKWKLEERGRLDFLDVAKTAELSQLQAELESMYEENNKLQFQLESLTQYPHLLQSQLKHLSEQIQAQKQQFNQKIQQTAQESQSLLNILNNNLNKIDTELKEIKNYLVSNHKQNLSKSNIDSNQNTINYEYQVIQQPVDQYQIPSSSQPSGESQFPWVSAYNHNPDNFSKFALEVADTEDSINQRRLGNNQAVIFEKVRRGRGNYWLLTVKNENYLVPRGDLKINQYNLQTITALFHFIGDFTENSPKFTLVKPAMVFPLEAEKWQLQERGVLKFEFFL